MKTFGNLYIDDFLLEKVVNQGIGTKMVRKYGGIFKPLLASQYIDPDDLETYTTKNFKRFLGTCLTSREWSSSTYNCYRKCLRAYCEFLRCEGYISENPIDNIKNRLTPKSLPKTLDRDQISELFQNLPVAFDEDTFHGLRNITIFHTFLHTGLRLSELTAIKIAHLRIHDGYLRVVNGKGSKDRTVPLSNEVMKTLIKYLRVRRHYFGCNDDLYLFPSVKINFLRPGDSQGGRLGGRDMRVIIEKVRYGITFHFTWHQLRHTFATELVRNNFDIYNISQILGHSDINTTKIYLSVDTDRLKKQLDSLSIFKSQQPRTHQRTMVVDAKLEKTH